MQKRIREACSRLVTRFEKLAKKSRDEDVWAPISHLQSAGMAERFMRMVSRGLEVVLKTS
jgi:hypothetical protein